MSAFRALLAVLSAASDAAACAAFAAAFTVSSSADREPLASAWSAISAFAAAKAFSNLLISSFEPTLEAVSTSTSAWSVARLDARSDVIDAVLDSRSSNALACTRCASILAVISLSRAVASAANFSFAAASSVTADVRATFSASNVSVNCVACNRDSFTSAVKSAFSLTSASRSSLILEMAAVELSAVSMAVLSSRCNDSMVAADASFAAFNSLCKDAVAASPALVVLAAVASAEASFFEIASIVAAAASASVEIWSLKAAASISDSAAFLDATANSATFDASKSAASLRSASAAAVTEAAVLSDSSAAAVASWRFSRNSSASVFWAARSLVVVANSACKPATSSIFAFRSVDPAAAAASLSAIDFFRRSNSFSADSKLV